VDIREAVAERAVDVNGYIGNAALRRLTRLA
jgi:hypothetical protein